MGLRWALSLSSTEASPNFELYFRKALQCLPSEDVAKQGRFHYRNDSLACVVGRIMIRAAACCVIGIPWHVVEVCKSDRGKPFLPGTPYHFNISHQGDLVVLATSKAKPIGVDVMRIDQERGSSAAQHIHRMRNLFSTEELAMMTSQDNENAKWSSFYRLWCLKEAVLKATGVGLVNDLNTYSFSCSPAEIHKPGCFIESTSYSEKGTAQKRWKFEESFIGENHCVAIGKIYESEEEASQARLKTKFFNFVTLENMIDNATPVNEEDFISLFEDFSNKPWKTF